MSALKAKMCEKEAPFTTRESLLGAAIVIGVSLLGLVVSNALEGLGYAAAGEAVALFCTTGGLLISMPFWLTKKQPARAQAVVVGVPLVLLAAIAVFTAMP